MAALAASAVALYPTGLGQAEFYPKGKDDRSVITRRLKLTLTGQGTATDSIGASALGFGELINCSALWDGQNSKGYPAVVDPSTNTILLLDGSAAPAPLQVTSTAAYIVVTGTFKNV